MDRIFLCIILTSFRNEFTSYQQNELQTAGENLQIPLVLLSRNQSAGNGANIHCRRGLQVPRLLVDERVMKNHALIGCQTLCSKGGRTQFSAGTRISKKQTCRSFYLLNTRTICVIFIYNCMQCIDGFSILLQRYVSKGNDAKNPAIFSVCLLWKETWRRTVERELRDNNWTWGHLERQAPDRHHWRSLVEALCVF